MAPISKKEALEIVLWMCVISFHAWTIDRSYFYKHSFCANSFLNKMYLIGVKRWSEKTVSLISPKLSKTKVWNGVLKFLFHCPRKVQYTGIHFTKQKYAFQKIDFCTVFGCLIFFCFLTIISFIIVRSLCKSLRC